MAKKVTSSGQMVLKGTEEGEILARLSERVERAITTIQELRRERDRLRERAEGAEAKLREQGEAASRLGSVEEEHGRFLAERGEIRNRIESILVSLEALDDE